MRSIIPKNFRILSGLEQIDRMRQLVREESAARRAEYERRMAKPLRERVEDGWCLAGLRWRGCDKRDPGVAEFSLSDGNESRLREGDYVRVSSAAESLGCRRATLFREEEHAIWLKLCTGGTWDDSWITAAGCECVVDADDLDLEVIYLRALEAVTQTAIGRECILPFLEGDELGDAADFLQQYEALADSQMNERQRDAVAECLCARCCHLVQGPPGTGKTRALAELATRCVRAGERVLITSFTHRAIHHALDAVVARLGEADRVVKVGRPVYTRHSAWRNYERFCECPLALDDAGWAVGATPFVLASRLRNVEFDRVIVDEAGQMTMPLAVMAMLTGRKWLFFGDGEQLGPVLTSVDQREAREWSCFRMLSQLAETTMLNTGYRMNGKLTAWPSDMFYQGQLEPAPGVKERRLSLPRTVRGPLAPVLDAAHPLAWVAFEHADGQVMQDEEALAAAKLVAALVQDGGLPPEEIAIVVPWRKQARRIRHHLRGRLPEEASRRCVVDTVERLQGQEREVVIVSLATSEPLFLLRHAGFIFQPNRLNVAVTRARTKTIVLASTALARYHPQEPEAAEDALLFRSLLESAARFEHVF